MSGRTKRILYYIADVALFLVLGVGMLLLTLFVPSRTEFPRVDAECWQYPLAVGLLAVGFPVLLHECGHLLFGLLAGMKLARFGFHPFTRGAVTGETAMYPKDGNHVKEKFFALTLGGAALNIVVGAALLVLWLLFPAHAMGCGAMSGFVFYEGVRALIPCELPAGKTDGAVLLGLLKHCPEEEVALRVLTAQGILYRGTFGQLPEALFSTAPVVREDLPALHALWFMKMQFLLARGDEEGAKEVLSRLGAVREEIAREEEEELVRYEGYFEGNFSPEESKLCGVNELELFLAEKCKKNSAEGQN